MAAAAGALAGQIEYEDRASGVLPPKQVLERQMRESA